VVASDPTYDDGTVILAEVHVNIDGNVELLLSPEQAHNLYALAQIGSLLQNRAYGSQLVAAIAFAGLARSASKDMVGGEPTLNILGPIVGDWFQAQQPEAVEAVNDHLNGISKALDMVAQ
jgi:hypothetical protein